MDEIKRLFGSLTSKQRFSIIVVVLAAIGSITWFTKWQHERDFRPLFTSLSPEDAGAMIQKLKEKSVEYRVSEGGNSILVPEDKLAELRLEMAGLGLPKTGRIGFEIFDKTNFSTTDFAEHVNYRRAIEGELERSIMSLAEVEQARVHVTFPKESVFLESREAAKASALIRLRAGAQLAPQNVAAITHLIASAVEGLSPEAVSVVDMRGNLLNRSRRGFSDDGGSAASLEYQQGIEKELTAKINSTLEPLLGAGKFRSGVFVECDMSGGEQSEETFDPAKSVMVMSQRTEEATGSSRLDGGQPGTASNLPRPPARVTGSASGPNRRVENITYQSSRTVRHTKLPQGVVKRLAVSVLVDQDIKWEGKGKQLQRVLIPPTPEKLKTIHDVVATLVGFSAPRGDQLIVETLPFDSTLNSEPPLPPDANGAKKADNLANKLFGDKQMNTWIAVAVVCLVMGTILVVMLRGKKRLPRVEAAPRALPPNESVEALRFPSGVNSESGESLSGSQPMAALPPSRSEVLLGQLKESARRDSELWASILKNWLAEEGSK